uniref:TauD domain-containing protein n=1 Tax=Angiostrongylus cantonensis TaxID=6313 RepID=A0A0K0DJ24_ANGCA
LSLKSTNFSGMKGKFPVIWLRDCSLDPKTYSIGPAMTARKLTMNEFDVEQNPKSVRLENEELVIDWEETQSRFNSNWLRFRNPSDNGARKHRRQVYLFPEDTWGKSDIERRLKKFSHTAVLSDDKTLHDFLEAVCMDGIAVIKNAPKGSTNVVRDIGERIGLIHSTHFGNPKMSNNSVLLENSQMVTILWIARLLQMLHMIEKAKEGGNNLFVDGFHVAEQASSTFIEVKYAYCQLRREKLDVFKVLTTSPIEFIEEGFDVHDGSDGRPSRFDYNMCSRHRTIKLDDSGRVVKIQFGNAMRSWFYDCEPEKIQEIYRHVLLRALKTFTDYCYQDKNILKLALENGDTVLWANTRLLHRRDAFRNAPNVSRTLAGCYFSWDIVKSKVRLLRRRLELPCAQPSV